MSYPAFFDNARKITVHDPLAELLGAADKGLIEYSYTDVVKLAGHSCPTVAGAYLMTLKALKVLYGNDIPERGGVRVQFRDGPQSGVTGVIANVVSLITGATSDTGFKGLAGQHDRRNLLFFNMPITGEICFQRVDTGASVIVAYHPEIVPSSPGGMQLLQKLLSGVAREDEKHRFADIWQGRVEQILNHMDDPRLITAV